MKYFYYAVFSKLNNNGNKKIKDVIKKLLKSLYFMSRFKTKVNGGVNTGIVNAGVTIEHNFSDNLDKVLDEWTKEAPDLITDQIDILGKALSENKTKIVVMIDEIDRLPAVYISNFLIFCRLLEKIENLISIIAIDYKQVINKFTSEEGFKLLDYSLAQEYLDKFFQIRIQVHQNKHRTTRYAIDRMQKIDLDDVLNHITNPNDYEMVMKFENIISYLGSPRKINKWLISIQYYYEIIKFSGDNITTVLGFLAATINTPIFLDYLSNHTLELASKISLPQYIDDEFDLNLKDVSREDILLASIGINKVENDNLEKFIHKLKIKVISDNTGGKYIVNMLEHSPRIANMIVGGYINEMEVKLFDSITNRHINEALNYIKSDESSTETMVYELADLFRNGKVSVTFGPNLETLNEIWIKKINEDFSNPYETIVLFCLACTNLENVINQSCATLSESKIGSILYAFDIKNTNGTYNINKCSKNINMELLKKRGLHGISYKGTMIKSFKIETIKEILREWLDMFEIRLSYQLDKLVKEPRFISAFYRFIQWGICLNDDNRDKLVVKVKNFMENPKVDNCLKSILIDALRNELTKEKSFLSKDKPSFISSLFNDDDYIKNILNIVE